MKLEIKEELLFQIEVFLDTLDTCLHTTRTIFKYMYIRSDTIKPKLLGIQI